MSEHPTQSRDSTPSQPTSDVLNAISAVESQLASLRKAAAERQELEVQLAERELSLTALETEIRTKAEVRESELKEREATLESRFEDLKRDASVIAQERERVEIERQEAADELARQRDRTDALERELLAQRADLDRDASALADQRAQIEESTNRLKSLQSETSQRAEKLEQRAHDLEQAEAKLAEQAKYLEDRLAELEENAREATDSTRDAIERAERAESQLAEADQRRLQAEQAVVELTASLEAMQIESEQISSKIGSHEERVEQVSNRASELESCVASLREQLEAKQAELDEAEESCRRIETDAKSGIEQLEASLVAAEQTGAQAQASIDEQRSRADALESQVQALASELEQARAQPSTDAEQTERESELTNGINLRDHAIAERDALIEALKEKLATATSKIQQFGEFIKQQQEQSGARNDEASDEVLRANERLQEQIRAMESELDTMRAERDSWRSRADNESGESSGKNGDLSFVDNRRARLSRMRQSLRAKTAKVRRANELLSERFDQCETLLSRRAELAAAHQSIQEQRERAIGRRSRSMAAGAMLAFVVMLAVLFGLSWVVAEKVKPGEYAAHAVISADSGERALTASAASEWQSYHESILGDPRFAETVADMLKGRGIASLGTPAAVHDAFANQLTLSSGSDGQVSLEYRDIGATRTQRVLDTIAVAMARTANKSRSRRTDGAMSVVSQVSEVGPEPIDGNRLVHAAAIFGGGLVLSLSFGAFVWRRMATAKSTFESDQQLQALLSEARWQDPRFDLEAESASDDAEAEPESKPAKQRRKPRKK